MVGQILFIPVIKEFIHHRSVFGEYEHFSYKNRGLSHKPHNIK
jgi:hypothetical protein